MAAPTDLSNIENDSIELDKFLNKLKRAIKSNDEDLIKQTEDEFKSFFDKINKERWIMTEMTRFLKAMLFKK